MKSFTEEDARTIAQQFVDSARKEEGVLWRLANAERCRIFKRKWNVVFHIYDADGTRLGEEAPIVVVNEMDKSASVFAGL
ncbi:MAG: hypothetical protein ACAI35_15840 [Candidatus Methylacidiphilales bacterium]|nr:hypothetical protein [Candidatus Methylacidiphilales bacterium]